MRLKSIMFGTALALSGTLASAQSSGPVPSELPPSDYRGAVYVDGSGCMFMRAGSAENVTWVARVTRSFEQMCGFQPTFGAPSTPAAAPASASVQVATKSSGPRMRATVTRSALPRGFKPAWTDGRLNPMRGPRTQAGDAAMALHWDDSVPMKRKEN